MWLMIIPAGTKRSPSAGPQSAALDRVVPALGGRISCLVVMAMGATAQWKRRIGLVLIWCGARVVYGGPALNRHWVWVSLVCWVIR